MTFNVDGNLNTVLLFVLGVVVATLVFARLANPDRLLDRMIYGFILLVLLIAYAIWRSTETLPPFELSARAIWPYVFYTFEMIAILSGIGYVLILTRTTDWSAEADAAERELERSGRYPAVDVFICTYDEPLNVLEKSIVAARSMSYPHFTVHVCDDTGRPEVRDYCSKLGVRYLTRPDNFQAKAGNLNNALRYTNLRAAPSDLIMVLDADFAPEERFLDRVVGLFRDPKIGIVQTPQFFYNSDPLQHNLGINRVFTDEQRVFFDKAQPSKDVDGCAFCVGTSFVARRSAINAIGGFPGDVITEDLWLTYRLMENGYITRWLNEKLSVGLSAEGVAEYITQRTRWCHGTFQIAMLKNGPLLGGRYTLLQRLHFLHGILHWLSKPYLICILLAPTVFWLFGVPAIQADELLFLKYGVSLALVCWAYSSWISGGRTLPVFTEVSQLIAAVPVTATLFRVLFRPRGKPFKVTAKGGDRSLVTVHWPSAAFFGLVALSSALAMLSVALSWDAPSTYSDRQILNFAWASIALLLSVVCLIVCVERPRFGQDELVDVDIRSWLHRHYAASEVRITGLSADHALIPDIGCGDLSEAALCLPDAGWVKLESMPGPVPGMVTLKPAFRQRIAILQGLFRTAPDNIARTGNFLGSVKGLARRAFFRDPEMQ